MKRILTILSIALLTSSSCKKDPEPAGPVTLNETNQWIYDQMKHYYLWSAELPEKYVSSSLDPTAYFYSLCHTSDRFTYILALDGATKASMVAEIATGSDTYETDFGFSSRLVTISGVVSAMQVLYVVPGSPADQVGIKRGDIFSKADDKPITSAYTYWWNQQETIRLTQCNASLDPIREVTISKALYLDHPVLADSVYAWGTNRVAYLVYKNFRPGGSNIFLDELKEKFAWFKRSGVNAMILDLRYNNGGELNVARTLASLIAPRVYVENKEIFARLEYNAAYYADLRKQNNEPEALRFELSTAELNSQNLNLNKLYVITGAQTASASEVVMHCLSDYIPVISYGEKTKGKNLGSITVTDSRKRVLWELHPIVTRIADRSGDYKFDNGITPTFHVDETTINIGDFGEILEDPFLLKLVAAEFPDAPGGPSAPIQPKIQSKGSPRVEFIYPAFRDAGTILDN